MKKRSYSIKLLPNIKALPNQDIHAPIAKGCQRKSVSLTFEIGDFIVVYDTYVDFATNNAVKIAQKVRKIELQTADYIKAVGVHRIPKIRNIKIFLKSELEKKSQEQSKG